MKYGFLLGFLGLIAPWLAANQGCSPSPSPALLAAPSTSLSVFVAAVSPPSASGSSAQNSPEEEEPFTVEEQRDHLLMLLRRTLHLSTAQEQVIRDVFSLSPYISQGNPELTVHPMTRAECREVRKEAGVMDSDGSNCGVPYMVPLYNPENGETEKDARVCIDAYEFPGIPCEYPVVFARASEAATLCRAIGKRLCDAHEWEGACAGALYPPEVDYNFDRDRLQATYQHNITRKIRWSYEGWRDPYRCATFGWRAPECTGEWSKCGSYTYPTGSFPSCRSPLGVYDLQGNVAEYMNLPLSMDELASRGDGGMTEMKGSWFGFFGKLPHEDDCRWRAPSWHETRVMSPVSHRNYHLGFRCCKDLGELDSCPSGG